ncbi:MAG: nucleotidyl transferase AbiEii/AbiGii toxin family protein [Candidatus Manganitrophus sp. SA1]|nr:nucleotidyl transferase AbiEii/AbiGii toxin family protein [Candidatus Manganitrophus morganii]
MKDSPFFRQAGLMLRVIPHVAAEKCFALKGGTAINLFIRNMPRLSVDIDLTYVPIESRDDSLKNISKALERIAEAIYKAIPSSKVQKIISKGSDLTTKLIVSYQDARIKIEPNEVIRGVVFPCEDRELCKEAEELFELSTSILTLSLADLFGGKICAALDRQHPRDLFDVKNLLEKEGITDDIRKAFVIYLASHDRPMSELIDPVRKDLHPVYQSEFLGMTAAQVPYEDLISARETCIRIIRKELTYQERSFLLSIKEGEPNWELMGVKGIEKLPAIQWKIINIRRMDKKKRVEALEKLRSLLTV